MTDRVSASAGVVANNIGDFLKSVSDANHEYYLRVANLSETKLGAFGRILNDANVAICTNVFEPLLPAISARHLGCDAFKAVVAGRQ